MNDVAYMRETVFFEGPRFRGRVSRFWILLVLVSVIAAAGVASDSTATVIGAMIIAPLMVPIQGTMLATVLGDPKNLSRSVGLMLAGAAAAVGIAVLVGLVLSVDVVAQNNSQVAARVHPRLIICSRHSAPGWSARSPWFAGTSPTPCPEWRSRSPWCRPCRWWGSRSRPGRSCNRSRRCLCS